jgi:hypothetical protein
MGARVFSRAPAGLIQARDGFLTCEYWWLDESATTGRERKNSPRITLMKAKEEELMHPDSSQFLPSVKICAISGQVPGAADDYGLWVRTLRTHKKNFKNTRKEVIENDNDMQTQCLQFWAARKSGSGGFPTGSGGFQMGSGGFQTRSGGFPTGSNTFCFRRMQPRASGIGGQPKTCDFQFLLV